MGVRMRMSRNTSIYLPFWAAIPLGVLWLAAWVVILLAWGLVSLAILAGKGIAALVSAHRA